MLPLRLARPAGRALRALCLGAHSDDVEIGCGGATLQLVAAGAVVHWAVFSGNQVRAEEAARSARLFLGRQYARQLHCHAYRDGFFPAELVGIKEACEALAQALRPDVIFSHTRDDRHQDHRVLSDLAWNTFRRHVVLEYEIPKWDGDLGRPNFYIPLRRAEAGTKVRHLMKVFATQRGKDWFTEDTFYGLMRLRGIECRAGSGFAEAFQARKLALEIDPSPQARRGRSHQR